MCALMCWPAGRTASGPSRAAGRCGRREGRQALGGVSRPPAADGLVADTQEVGEVQLGVAQLDTPQGRRRSTCRASSESWRASGKWIGMIGLRLMGFRVRSAYRDSLSSFHAGVIPPPRPLPQHHRYPLRPRLPLASALRRPRAGQPLPVPAGAAPRRRRRRRHTRASRAPAGGWPNIPRAARWTCWGATTTSTGRPRPYERSARPSPMAWRRSGPRPRSSRFWSGCGKRRPAAAATGRRWWRGVTAFTCPCARGRLIRRGRRRR